MNITKQVEELKKKKKIDEKCMSNSLNEGNNLKNQLKKYMIRRMKIKTKNKLLVNY